MLALPVREMRRTVHPAWEEYRTSDVMQFLHPTSNTVGTASSRAVEWFLASPEIDEYPHVKGLADLVECTFHAILWVWPCFP